MRVIGSVCFAAMLAGAGDSGVPPRATASDYPVHQNAKTATLAAVLVPAEQTSKMFSADIARRYVVVEVAVYPTDGHEFDCDWFDFALKIGNTISHVEKPRDVATPWPEKNTSPQKPVSVTSETGVIYSRTNDPINGRRSGWGTYEGVAVTTDPRASAPPPPRHAEVDPQMIERRVRERSLPEGRTRSAIAGYLFYPQYSKKHKADAVELQYSKDEVFVTLRFPAN